jgi:hypothetical protein
MRLRQSNAVLFDRTTVITWLPRALAAAAMVVVQARVDTFLFVWCLSGQSTIDDAILEAGDYCTLQPPIAAVAGDGSLLCHFADTAACIVSDCALNDPDWDAFCAVRGPLRCSRVDRAAVGAPAHDAPLDDFPSEADQATGCVLLISTPSGSKAGAVGTAAPLVVSADGAADTAGIALHSLIAQPPASGDSATSQVTEALIGPVMKVRDSDKTLASTDDDAEGYHEHKIPVLTVHHFLFQPEEDGCLSDLALRCLRSWSYGHRQIVWHDFDGSFATRAVSRCEWRSADAIVSKDMVANVAENAGLQAARLTFANRVLQICGGVFSDLDVFWSGRRLPLPPAGPNSLLVVADLKCGGRQLLFARSRSPLISPSPSGVTGKAGIAPLVVSASGRHEDLSTTSSVAEYFQGWESVHLDKAVCCLVVDTIQGCEAAGARPHCFLPSDMEAEARSRAVLAVEEMAPTLRSLVGDSSGLRVQADVFDALYVRGRWDAVPLGTPAAIAIALVAAMPRYCTNPEDGAPVVMDRLSDVLAPAQAVQLVHQVRAVLPRVTVLVINHLNYIPAARGVDYGVPC